MLLCSVAIHYMPQCTHIHINEEPVSLCAARQALEGVHSVHIPLRLVAASANSRALAQAQRGVSDVSQIVVGEGKYLIKGLVATALVVPPVVRAHTGVVVASASWHELPVVSRV
jgi:hypothetical protein